MKQLILLISISIHYLLAAGQTVNMDVLMGIKSIGSITAEKKITGKTASAWLRSKVSVRIIIKVNVEQTIVSEYKDGKLMKADVVRTSNISSENKKSAILWNGREYIITKDTITVTHKEPVTFCVLDLYFTEPVGITKVFGETGGTYMPIVSMGDHRYELHVNESKRDIFLYDKEGKLVQIETVVAMKKVTFKVK